MIIPINKCILIEADKEESVFQNPEKKYAERGTVLAIAEDCPPLPFKIGDKVCFASHFAYRKEVHDKDFWFILYDKLMGIDNG